MLSKKPSQIVPEELTSSECNREENRYMGIFVSKLKAQRDADFIPQHYESSTRSKISEYCDRILHRLWFVLSCISLLSIHTAVFICYMLIQFGHVQADQSVIQAVLAVGWAMVFLFALETVARLLTSGLLNVHCWSGLLDTTTGAVVVAVTLSTTVPVPLMLFRLPRLVSLVRRTYAIKKFDEELVGRERMGSITTHTPLPSVNLSVPDRQGFHSQSPRQRSPSNSQSYGGKSHLLSSRRTSLSSHHNYFGKAMLALITDAGSYAGDIPAVRLLQLLYRSIQVSCTTYTPLEKKELRQLMVLLSRNRIYVDRNLQRSNEAYYKEFHGDSMLFLDRGVSSGSSAVKKEGNPLSDRGSGRLRRSWSGQSPIPSAGSPTHIRNLTVMTEVSTDLETIHDDQGDVGSTPRAERGRRRSLIVNLTKNRSKSPRGMLPNSVTPRKSKGLKTHKHTRTLSARFLNKTTQKSRIDSCLERVDFWDFDVFELEECSLGNPLLNISRNILVEERYEFVRTTKIEHGRLLEFLIQIEQGYGSGQEDGVVNKYHNRVHAADVLQTVHYFLSTCGFSFVLTDLEQLALLLAALVHDFRHPGRSNLFICKTRGKLAIMYNDLSVLENFHISQAMALLQQDRYNFLLYLDDPTFANFRKYMIGLVLATDLKFHFDLLGEFNALTAEVLDTSAASNISVPEKSEEDTSQLIFSAMKICLKAADIAHPTKNLELHKKWTDLLAEEFFLQGDEERKLGLEVSPPYCRQTTNLAESQKGFINFLVKPLFASWVKYLNSEDAAIVIGNLENNVSYWQELIDQQVIEQKKNELSGEEEKS